MTNKETKKELAIITTPIKETKLKIIKLKSLLKK
tara:strand:+ start:805 stop:906 length:102 start_codon:yes stop_codon:yes gene_type:complete